VTAPTQPPRIATSLGPPLVADDGVFVLDLGALPILHGLSVLSRALAEMILGQARSDRIDIAAERRLRPRENPELLETFGIDLVKVAAEHDTVAAIAAEPAAFERRLRALLGSLQREQYRAALLPQDRRCSRALVAEFGGALGHRFVLEFVPGRGDGDGVQRGCFRITIESRTGRRLDLASLPHVRIDDIEDRCFIAGSTRIAQTWTEAVRREAERGRRTFVEQRQPHSHLFRQLDQAELAAVERVAIVWSEAAMPFVLESEPAEVSETMKRVLLALEDRQVRRLLDRREVVRVDGGALPIFLDLAQLGRVLTLSLGRRRQRADVDSFLDSMPALGAATARARAAQPLAGVRVFLVHHTTGEVLGLIAALRALGCRDLICTFVSSAGETPASYLDAVLGLPDGEFTALALANVPRPGHVEGQYRLSTQYSRLDDDGAIARALHGRDGSYLSAMRAAALGPFLRQLARAEQAADRCLLIEDGGYLGPILHDAALRGVSLRAFAAEHGHACDDDRPTADVLRARCLGSVEHTRNGFDRLAEVERAHGRLALPVFSIAVSRLKRNVESKEVAASVLNAVESVLNAGGRVLARRSCLVIGSHGAIGRELCRALAGRLDDPVHQLAGVDLAAAPGREPRRARTLQELGEAAWLATDLVLGVAGASVVRGDDVAAWLLRGARPDLVLASGSTKTVEFKDVMAWLDAVLQQPEPRVGGRRAAIAVEAILDPRTERLYGHRYSFTIDGVPGRRSLVCLANLTPVNFLFYGVATELIDDVLAQLLSVSLGLVRRAGDPSLAPRLHAVDRDIDAEGAAIGSAATAP
jgi:hypothetical protein